MAARLRAAVSSATGRAWQEFPESSIVQGRPLGLALVIGAHLVGLWLFAQMRPPISVPQEAEFRIALASTIPAPNPLPSPPMVSPDEVPAPDIEIAANNRANAIVSIYGETQLIAPRPDPEHPNIPPAVNDSLVPSHLPEVVLRILVTADGTIDDAEITKSCGIAELDALALAFAKAHWRYLPATLAGKAVQDWATVIVPLR